MKPNEVKALIQSIIVVMKNEKTWHNEEGCTYNKALSHNRMLGVSFIKADPATGKRTCLIHTNYMGVWMTEIRHRLNKLQVMKPKQVMDQSSMQRLQQLEIANRAALQEDIKGMTLDSRALLKSPESEIQEGI